MMRVEAPLLIARGDDGVVNAVLNVCRHRGTRVETMPCGGGKKAFVCPYHGWSYGRDGSLLGMPHDHGFAGMEARGLTRVECSVAAGLIFVGKTRGEAWLGDDIIADLTSFGLASSTAYAPRSEERALSWKLAVEVFLETYHLRPVHQNSIYPMFFDNIGLVDPIGPHLRNVFPKRSIKTAEGADLRKHANVLYHLFPNTLILVEPDHAAVLTLWPRGPARTLLTSFTLVPEPPVTDKARAYWDANNKILYGAIAEDFAMGESIQRGLSSGANRDVVFAAFEHALAHFHRQLDRFGSA